MIQEAPCFSVFVHDHYVALKMCLAFCDQFCVFGAFDTHKSKKEHRNDNHTKLKPLHCHGGYIILPRTPIRLSLQIASRQRPQLHGNAACSLKWLLKGATPSLQVLLAHPPTECLCGNTIKWVRTPSAAPTPCSRFSHPTIPTEWPSTIRSDTGWNGRGYGTMQRGGSRGRRACPNKWR